MAVNVTWMNISQCRSCSSPPALEMGLSDCLISDRFLRHGRSPALPSSEQAAWRLCKFLLLYPGSLGRYLAGCVDKVLIYGEVSGCLLEMSDGALGEPQRSKDLVL